MNHARNHVYDTHGLPGGRVVFSDHFGLVSIHQRDALIIHHKDIILFSGKMNIRQSLLDTHRALNSIQSGLKVRRHTCQREANLAGAYPAHFIQAVFDGCRIGLLEQQGNHPLD